MVVEAINLNNESGGSGEEKVFILPPTKVFSAERMTILLADPDTLFSAYSNPDRGGLNFTVKYNLAHQLISRVGEVDEQQVPVPTVPTPLRLITDFFPSQAVLACLADEEREKVEGRMHTDAKVRRDSLIHLAIEKGLITPDMPEYALAEEYLSEVVVQNQHYQSLIASGWPIEVMGQLATVEMFRNMNSTQIAELARGMVTRSFYDQYLGVLGGKKIARDNVPLPTALASLPRRIFEKDEQMEGNLVLFYLSQQLMRMMTDMGVEQGALAIEELISETTDPQKREFIETEYAHLISAVTEPLPDTMKSTIMVQGSPRAFPSTEQAVASFDHSNYETNLVVANTGLGKSLLTLRILEKPGVGKSMIFVPAEGRATWEREVKVGFHDEEDVFVVKGGADLPKALESGKRRIIVSYELVANSASDPRLEADLLRLIQTGRVNSAGLDEIHNLWDTTTKSFQQVRKFVGAIRDNWDSSYGAAPIIGTTATIVLHGTTEDMNGPMAILYPERYVATRSEAHEGKLTFSDTYANSPQAAYMALVGRREMFRWEHATGVQELAYNYERITPSPFEEYLYDFIADHVETNALEKIRLLELVSLNPHLLKTIPLVRETASRVLAPFSLEHAVNTLNRVVDSYKKTRKIQSPESDSDIFNVDKLIQLGMGELVLSAFFSPLSHGLDTLINDLSEANGVTENSLEDVRPFWRDYTLSSKYTALRDMVREAVIGRDLPDGRKAYKKVSIVSPGWKQGVTSDVAVDGDELSYITDTTLVKQLKEWVGDLLPAEGVSMIDGSVRLGDTRDRVIDAWRFDVGNRILVSTIGATSESRDFSIANIENDDEVIDGVLEIFLGPPWYYYMLRQRFGRDMRQGQKVPVEGRILLTAGLIDEGKAEAVEYSRLYERMVLSGIQLNSREKEVFDAGRRANRLPYHTQRSTYLRDVLTLVASAGEETVSTFLGNYPTGKETNSKTHAELVAEMFYADGNDRFHITGYNANLIASLISEKEGVDASVLSIGAGTLLLQRFLERGIDNLDINMAMMQAGWREAQQFGGKLIEGRASALDLPEQTYDVVDLSYMLHWTKNDIDSSGSERVKVLKEVFRVAKPGATIYMAFPEKAFTSTLFTNFTQGLAQMGYLVDISRSGMSYGLHDMGLKKRIGWVITAEKGETDPTQEIDSSFLAFTYDSATWRSDQRKKAEKGTVKKEYPVDTMQIELDSFEIIYPGTGQVHVSGELDINPTALVIVEEKGTNEPNEVDEGIVFDTFVSNHFGTTEEAYRTYRNLLLRPVMRKTGWSWEKAREFIVEQFSLIESEGKNLPLTKVCLRIERAAMKAS